MGDTTAIEWTAIPRWPKYEVTRDGQIRNATRKNAIKLQIAQRGHLYFTPARGRKCYAHTAVLEAFVGPRPSAAHEGRHLDGIPAHNALDNLAWGTALENAHDKQRHGTQSRGERAGTAKLTEAQVRTIRQRIGTASLRQLGKEYGVSHTAIRRAANGAKWSHVA